MSTTRVNWPRPSGIAARLLLPAALAVAAALGLGGEQTYAAPIATDPLFVFSPVPEPPPNLPVPPPNGYLNGPCGIAVDHTGDFYVADYYHDTIDVYDGTADYNAPPVFGSRGYLGQLRGIDALDGPCGLAIGSGGDLFVNTYHRAVRKYGPAPNFSPGPVGAGAGADALHPTGVAADPTSGQIYVDARAFVGVYEASGAPVEDAGGPVRIGEGTLGDGYGVAVSGYPGTKGYVYVPDGESNTVKVYNPALDAGSPAATIDGPPGGFNSLRDSVVAVDSLSGAIYVVDTLQPAQTESPHGLIQVFSPSGEYEGHLKFEVVVGPPTGLAVDNSEGPTQGRVYVTSGNTHLGAIYAYPPGAATTADPIVGPVPPAPVGGGLQFPLIPIGGEGAAGPGEQIACDGDDCQILPPRPEDPAVATLASGAGNPKVRYRRYARRYRKGHRRHRIGQRSGGHRRRPSAAAHASASEMPGSLAAGTGGAGASGESQILPQTGVSALSAISAGFKAHVWADGGATASLSGSHPYSMDLSVALADGAAPIRKLRLDLPPGLLIDPPAAALCGSAAFATPRSSPFAASAAGESCGGSTQVGTVDVQKSPGESRRFGLFQLNPQEGVAARFGAAPFGFPLVFDARFDEVEGGFLRLVLESSEVPNALNLEGASLTFWGTPWASSHNGERANCLNEVDPSFPWAKCSVGEPLKNPPLAFLTLPTECGQPLAFASRAERWSGSPVFEEALNRDGEGEPVLMEACDGLDYEPEVEGTLSSKKVTSPSGYVLRLSHDDPGFVVPGRRSEPRTQSASVQLPEGVTLNPSLAAGLEGCTPAQLAAESAEGPQRCPNSSKIGNLNLRVPFYKGLLEGSVYLAQPYENPYGSLLAVYLVAKAADRGILVKARGKLTPDPGDGTISARFDGLSQLPYEELKIIFRSGQRAPLVTPPSCGAVASRIGLTSWSGAAAAPVETVSPLEAGIEDAPCPSGTPPFAPTAVAGGVNSNVGSFTPYFVHLARRDPEQEITSYSMVLPQGITGKLAGIPFCPDEAIAAARASRGVDEAARPSCPTASQVGRTVTGYGVGPSLAYSDGKIYLAGPYHGAPLSLVTINPVTVGPFDLGTIVIRSAFELDPRTAQLRIASDLSDPVPHIIDGVVLHVRDIRVYIDRPEFTHNPSSCEPSQLISTLTGSGASFADVGDDSTATVSERFQLLNCRTLGFRPALGLRLRGPSRRGAYPSLRASFVSRGPRDANLKRIEIDMPHQLFLAQNHIRTICTRPQFASERCPAGSVYGKASAKTPLLEEPLRGEVYLRSSEGKLPDLVADLRSGSIRIVVEGRIGPSGSGGIRAFFDNVPDAPIERFTVLLQGGRGGLLTNSVDVCRHPPRAAVKALGQNNVGAIFTARLRGQCGQRPSKRHGQVGR